jgi:ribosome-binding protein aMBF1 (putative translation factor)
MNRNKELLFQIPPTKYDDPDEIGRALKRLGMSTLKLATKFASSVVRSIESFPNGF